MHTRHKYIFLLVSHFAGFATKPCFERWGGRLTLASGARAVRFTLPGWLSKSKSSGILGMLGRRRLFGLLVQDTLLNTLYSPSGTFIQLWICWNANSQSVQLLKFLDLEQLAKESQGFNRWGHLRFLLYHCEGFKWKGREVPVVCWSLSRSQSCGNGFTKTTRPPYRCPKGKTSKSHLIFDLQSSEPRCGQGVTNIKPSAPELWLDSAAPRSLLRKQEDPLLKSANPGCAKGSAQGKKSWLHHCYLLHL